MHSQGAYGSVLAVVWSRSEGAAGHLCAHETAYGGSPTGKKISGETVAGEGGNAVLNASCCVTCWDALCWDFPSRTHVCVTCRGHLINQAKLDNFSRLFGFLGVC